MEAYVVVRPPSSKRLVKNEVTSRISFLADPTGVEPVSTASEAAILSIELRVPVTGRDSYGPRLELARFALISP